MMPSKRAGKVMQWLQVSKFPGIWELSISQLEAAPGVMLVSLVRTLVGIMMTVRPRGHSPRNFLAYDDSAVSGQFQPRARLQHLPLYKKKTKKVERRR